MAVGEVLVSPPPGDELEGEGLGGWDGDCEGDGFCVGDCEGDGFWVGDSVGDWLGDLLGDFDGDFVGLGDFVGVGVYVGVGSCPSTVWSSHAAGGKSTTGRPSMARLITAAHVRAG